MKRGKTWRAARAKVDRLKEYPIIEAFEFLKENASAKFDESVEMAINLGVDPRKSDQAVRGAVVVPHGLGKQVRILVFAQGEKATEAQAAGADYVGSEDFADKIKDGWLEFDAVVATPDQMKVVGKLGKILGTRGLMPNPKVGTVTMDVTGAINDLKKGKIEYRVDKGGILHAPIGKLSFDTVKLVDNAKAFHDAVVKSKPSASKGQYIKRVSVTSTMGQGLRVAVADMKN